MLKKDLFLCKWHKKKVHGKKNHMNGGKKAKFAIDVRYFFDMKNKSKTCHAR